MPAWAGPAAIAAGVAALAGFGLSQASDLGSDDSAAGTSTQAPAQAGDNAETATGSGLAPFAAGGIPLAASGLDYRAATLASTGSPAKRAMSSDAAPAQEGQQPPGENRDVAPSLDRLRGPGALAACITAIGVAHPPGVTSVEVVDLASFEGSPAAVVFFTDGSGARWIWASGPDCGLPASGADTRGSAKIG
ncbi:hypothetical protein Psuf_032530 [Phytohabitans suffuscus]|uniref:Uncharacterized protein n=1 Tax=Phytohabitans suffuscus TaxID=624315 RepID=A0A6F8YIN7_9ACTN|nr:hypothetical protein [Phytohabitans suffuscus]BCB85940.1 hypothetical protein Psuf_032530 [Phytohabitans suffuscus]